MRLDAVGGAALLDHLEDDLLHLLVGRLELADEDQHHLARVIVGVLGVHQRDQVADGLQKRRQTCTSATKRVSSPAPSSQWPPLPLPSIIQSAKNRVRRLTFSAVGADTLPEGFEDRVEALDAVGRGGFGQGGDGQGRDGAHLLLLVDQSVLDDLDEVAQVGQDGAAHQDGDLLHDLDARVARLPRLFALAHRLSCTGNK